MNSFKNGVLKILLLKLNFRFIIFSKNLEGKRMFVSMIRPHRLLHTDDCIMQLSACIESCMSVTQESLSIITAEKMSQITRLIITDCYLAPAFLQVSVTSKFDFSLLQRPSYTEFNLFWINAAINLCCNHPPAYPPGICTEICPHSGAFAS